MACSVTHASSVDSLERTNNVNPFVCFDLGFGTLACFCVTVYTKNSSFLTNT